jgi:hypothetical protein
MSPNDRYEILAALYYARFKELAPGKDRGMMCPQSDEDRLQNAERFNAWLSSGQAHEDALAEIFELNAQVENHDDEVQTLKDKVTELEGEVDSLTSELNGDDYG